MTSSASSSTFSPIRPGSSSSFDGVAAVGPLDRAAAQRPLQGRQRFVGDRERLARGRRRVLADRGRAQHLAVEAAALAGVAGGPGRVDHRHQGVAVAVVAELAQVHEAARAFAFFPEFVAGAAVEVQVAGLERHFQRFRADVGEHQHLAGGEVLDHAGRQPPLIEFDFPEHRPNRSDAARLLDAEPVEQVLVAAPVAAHADAEVEVDPGVELAPRASAARRCRSRRSWRRPCRSGSPSGTRSRPRSRPAR